MQITYELSGRQRKELIERGRPLSIAIPAPVADDEYDELAYARASLPTLEPQWIIAAEEVAIGVNPLDRDAAGQGLMGRLGSIVPDDAAHLAWRVPVLAVVATIQTEARPRHRIGPTQWAAAVLIDGRRI